ncbi:hypothetical protein K2173_013083 [Erythroxylum novogranatense]|uniref:Uncharacterized protein n=1 Tax=Erythroxylum novogranatense TaxID=1862640 RepID=A0AAV8S673_9ROSI|nr:hypothetical protein K2173_013083 [Erythroxylum novogranatense]
MRLFMLDDGNGSKNLSVISIMGMGGIGKTTLAQLIYRDDRVQERFDVKGWVCVSEDFDVPRITRDILNEVAPIAWDDKTLNQLQSELEKKLTGKRFLFVLDDVWNERFTDWNILLRPLKYGSPGSKIIITTRNDGVASTVSSNSIFRLNMLSSLNSWQLFCIHAFEDHNSSDYPCLEEIGREIVKRCHGLPLAVKVMGGLLRSKKNVKDWVNVLRNSLWDFSEGDIFPVLRLSYHYLPSLIKWCFASCSIFPKAYEFKKEELVLLWIGEGLVISPNGNKTVEEVGDELVSRSFFQPVNDSYSSKFVMHDLLDDLARVLAGESCFRFEGKDFCKTPKRTRYFSCVVVEQESSQQLSDILKSTHLLRTFLPVYTSRWQRGKIQQEVIRVLFLKQQRLRVLSISQCEHVVELPSSIGQLKHLRYLDFSATPITSLPECLCSLYNVQTLKLNQCNKLAELPTNMGRLINMQYLDIEGTNLQEMPPNMGKLIKLQKLTDFFVGKREGCRVKELGNLQHLRGTLKIQNPQNVVNAQDSLEAKVNCKKYLKYLKLKWKGDTDDSHHEKVVLDRLQPHTEIEAISIIGYGGTSFPNWLGGSAFTKLFSLELKGCRYCSCLPPRGQILSLKYLTIIGFDAVMVINSDFYGRCLSSSMKPFRSLEILSFIDMPQLQEWIPYGTEEQTGAFPCLKQLYLTNCPTLTSSLPNHLPSLTTFEINACPQLQFCVPNSPNLSSMVFSDGSREMYFHDSTSLNIIQFYCQDSALEKMGKLGYSVEQITIEKYEPLECFPLELFPKLRSLDIKKCSHYESFCTSNQECLKFVPFEFLTELLLWDCPKLKFLPQCMHYLLPSLLDLRIYGCPEIETFPEDGLPSKL